MEKTSDDTEHKEIEVKDGKRTTTITRGRDKLIIVEYADADIAEDRRLISEVRCYTNSPEEAAQQRGEFDQYMRDAEERLSQLSLLPLDDQLFAALHEGSLLRAQELVSRGAQLIDAEGKLLRSVGYSRSEEFTRWVIYTWPWLIPAGQNNRNASLFFHSLLCGRGSLALITTIVQSHPWLLDTKDSLGRTVLHAAAAGGDDEIVQYIIQHRPLQLTATTEKGERASEIALQWRHDDLAKWLTLKEMQAIPLIIPAVELHAVPFGQGGMKRLREGEETAIEQKNKESRKE